MKAKLLQICKSKIDDGFTYDKLRNFIESNSNESIFSKIKEEVEDYIDKKIENLQKNKLYWMLICNPQKWYEGTEKYQVNQLLRDLDEDTIES
jgi:G:T/U-mismatch repair DNA glycosylase